MTRTSGGLATERVSDNEQNEAENPTSAGASDGRASVVLLKNLLGGGDGAGQENC
jgi:hypothetical protein